MKRTRLYHIGRYVLVLALLLVVVFGIRRCVAEIDRNRSNVVIQPEKVFEKIYLADSSIIALQRAEIVDLKEMNRRLNDENSRLRNAKSIVKTETVTRVEKVTVEIHDTIKDTSVISVPKPFRVAQKGFLLSGKIVKSGLNFDTLQSTVGLTVSIGEKKPTSIKEYFSPRQLYSEVKSSNPYTTIASVQTYVLDAKPKWHERRGVWFIAGAAMTTILFLSPP